MRLRMNEDWRAFYPHIKCLTLYKKGWIQGPPTLVLYLRNIPYNPRGALILTFDIGRGMLWGHFKFG